MHTYVYEIVISNEFSTLKKDTASSSETLESSYQSTRCHTSQGCNHRLLPAYYKPLLLKSVLKSGLASEEETVPAVESNES